MKSNQLKVKDKHQLPLIELFNQFDPISLEETNNRAQMLTRFDNKYVVSRDEFELFLNVLHDDFEILEMNGIRGFSYQSCYFDDQDFRCYIDHLNGRRRRFKVRTREYVDSNLIFFEVKLKGIRGKTDKHRVRSAHFSPHSIGTEELAFLKASYKSNYKTIFTYDLKPTLIVSYNRCTLVARKGGERVTIDFALGFSPFNQSDKEIRIGDNFIIVETKSGDGRGLADNLMKSIGIRQASNCSKYCLGVNLTGLVTRNNKFLPMIRLISKNIVSGKRIFMPHHIHSVKEHHQKLRSIL